LNDLIRRVTVNPAREIHRPELGTLSVGKEADVAVLEELTGNSVISTAATPKMNADVQIVRANYDSRWSHSLRSLRPHHDRVGRKRGRNNFSTPAEGSSNPATADDFPRH